MIIRVATAAPSQLKRDSSAQSDLQFTVDGQITTGANIVAIQWLDESVSVHIHTQKRTDLISLLTTS